MSATTKWAPASRSEGQIILSRTVVQTMAVKVGADYEIAKRKAWGGGNRARVTGIGRTGALCTVEKIIRRSNGRWEKRGETLNAILVPFNAFLSVWE